MTGGYCDHDITRGFRADMGHCTKCRKIYRLVDGAWKPTGKRVRSPRRKPATPPVAIVTQRLGRCVQIQYQDERGRLKTHIFPRGAELHATRDGTQLIVDGVKVRDKEIH